MPRTEPGAILRARKSTSGGTELCRLSAEWQRITSVLLTGWGEWLAIRSRRSVAAGVRAYRHRWPALQERETMKHFKDVELSNPRREAVIDNWPFGRERCTAKFSIEVDPRCGERAVRITSDRRGGWNSPKKLTYARHARICDGSDGKTYIVEHCPGHT